MLLLELRQENCAGELEDLRRRVRELDEVEEKAESLEREVERLTEECGVARDEATGLKYQLSSTNMELQLTKEVYTVEPPIRDPLR